MNTTEFLMIASAIVPDRTAVVFEGQQISFEMLQERVNRLANAMSELGIGPGDRVAAMQTSFSLHQLAHTHNLHVHGMLIDPSGLPPDTAKALRAKTDQKAS